MADRAIYQEAIARWGAESQLRMVQEECGELIAAINRFDRGRCGPEVVAEEIADVQIMAEQAALLVGEGLVAKAKAAKLERLRGRLAEAPAREGGDSVADPALERMVPFDWAAHEARKKAREGGNG